MNHRITPTNLKEVPVAHSLPNPPEAAPWDEQNYAENLRSSTHPTLHNTYAEASEEAKKLVVAGVIAVIHRTAGGFEVTTPRTNKTPRRVTMKQTRRDAANPATDYDQLSPAQRQKLLQEAVLPFHRAYDYVQGTMAEDGPPPTNAKLSTTELNKLRACGVYPFPYIGAARRAARSLLEQGAHYVTLAAHPSRTGEVWAFADSRPSNQQYCIERWRKNPDVSVALRRHCTIENVPVHRDPYYCEPLNSVPAVVPMWQVEMRDPMCGDTKSLLIRAMTGTGAEAKARAIVANWQVTDCTEVVASFAEAELYDDTGAALCADDADDPEHLAQIAGVEATPE